MRKLQLFGCGLWLLVSLTMATTTQAQDIYFNPANAVGTGHAEAISFAAWSWSERSGFAAEYAGTTTRECIDGAIVVQTASATTWPYDPKRYPAALARSTTCGKGGYLVQLRNDVGAQQEVLSHEVGHTLVNLPVVPLLATHLTDRYTLMNNNPKQVSAVTYRDADAGVLYARWPLYRAPSYCYVELLPNYDLYIPDIGGSRAQLSYTGEIDGYQTWTKKSSTPAVNTCASNELLPDGSAVLHDIRGQFIHYDSAEFEYLGDDTWRLISTQ